jgi:hypothetical protein
MRKTSLFLLLPIAIFANPNRTYESDVIIPKALQSSNISSINQTSPFTASPSKDSSTYIIEQRLPLPVDEDIIIPKSFQDNPTYRAKTEEVVQPQEESIQSPQSVAISRVIQYQPTETVNMATPKMLEYTTNERTITTEVLTPKTAMPIHSVEIPQIQGTYILNRGVERNAKIDNAMLIIEKLDEDDFGYYYVSKIDKFPASGLPGIFHYDIIKKRFVNKVKETEFSTKTEENIEIKYDGKHLETILDISVGKRAILWDKVEGNCQADPSIINALRDVQDSYRQIYQNNKNFLLD